MTTASPAGMMLNIKVKSEFFKMTHFPSRVFMKANHITSHMGQIKPTVTLKESKIDLN